MRRRFWVSAALSLPLLIWVMGEHLLGLGHAIPRQMAHWLQLALATPVVLWAGWPIFKRCWASFQNLSPNMWTLIGIGVGAAYLYSVVATIAPGIFPAAFRGPEGQVDVYFEAAAVIVALVLLGQVLELRARERTSGAIKALLQLAPETARRCVTAVSMKKCRLSRCRSATACGCARATRSRSTAKLSKGAAQSTSRC